MPESLFVENHMALIRKNVRSLRGNMTQKAFAAKAGVSRTTIQRIEDGKNFEIISLFKIAEGLHLHPYELCIDEKEKQEIRGQVRLYRDILKQELKDEILRSKTLMRSRPIISNRSAPCSRPEPSSKEKNPETLTVPKPR